MLEVPPRVQTPNLIQTMAEVSRLYRHFLREVGKSVSIRFVRSFLGWIC